MCKRGHPSRYHKPEGGCYLCGAENTAKWRNGTPHLAARRFRLRLDTYRKLKKRRRVDVMCELGGVSVQTFNCWVKNRHTGEQALTDEGSARRFTQGVGVPFEEMWEEME